MQVHELPPLDAVVLSHLHDDHFDRIARDGLPKQTPIITTRAAADTLRSWGFTQAVALETWQTHELRSPAGDVLRVSAAPGRHARGPLQALLPPVHGHVLEYAPVADPAMSVYITGDTLLVDDLRQVPERHPDLDLGLWHLGRHPHPRHLRPRRARDDGRARGGRPARARAAAHDGADPLRRLRRLHEPAVGVPGRGGTPRAARRPPDGARRDAGAAAGAVHRLSRRCRRTLAGSGR
jgi:hypothetical protein